MFAASLLHVSVRHYGLEERNNMFVPVVHAHVGSDFVMCPEKGHERVRPGKQKNTDNVNAECLLPAKRG